MKNEDVDENGVVKEGPFAGSHTKPGSVRGMTERELVWHRPTPATRGPGPSHGTETAYEETHPAFGMISASRGTGGGAVLFDSDIRHQHTIRLTIQQASRQRDLNRDWIHGENSPLIEIEMSEAQWASFISTLNTSGVPCTIRRTESNYNVDGLIYEPRLKESLDEIKGAAQKVFGRINQAMAEWDALDPKAGVKERRAVQSRIRNAVEHAESNMTFAAKSLEEHAENVVQKARNDIEAMVTQRAIALGVDPQVMAFTLEGQQEPKQIEARGFEMCQVCGSDEDPCPCDEGYEP